MLAVPRASLGPPSSVHPPLRSGDSLSCATALPHVSRTSTPDATPHVGTVCLLVPVPCSDCELSGGANTYQTLRSQNGCSTLKPQPGLPRGRGRRLALGAGGQQTPQAARWERTRSSGSAPSRPLPAQSRDREGDPGPVLGLGGSRTGTGGSGLVPGAVGWEAGCSLWGPDGRISAQLLALCPLSTPVMTVASSHCDEVTICR